MNLRNKNPHPKDNNVKEHPNYDDNHVYLINNESHLDLGYKSVTTFISQFTEKFDPLKIFEIWERKQDPRLELKSKDEWIQFWQEIGDKAAKKGTWVHKQIENYFNDEKVEDWEDKNFKAFLKYIKHTKIKPYRTEMSVYSEDIKLVGNIDFITDNEDGTYNIWDWKTRKDLNPTAFFGKWFKEPIDELRLCDNNKYALQLSIYKYILETKYDMKIRDLFNVLICGEEYKVVKQKYLQDEMEKLFK
jgi:hypothetical protein